MPVLSVSKLSMAFGERTLFEDMSFEVATREKVGLIGRNGVGKPPRAMIAESGAVCYLRRARVCI